MGEAATRAAAIVVSAFLLYAVLVQGWSAGQLLVGVWLQTTVLWVLVALGGLVLAARAHWGVALVAVPVGAFVGFVSASFIDFFGMFAWAAWAAEQGTTVRMLSFNPFRNSWHFVRRVPEVLPGWQVALLVALQTGWTLTALVGSRQRMAQGLQHLFFRLHTTIMVNHVALLLGVALAVHFGAPRALLVALLGLLLAIDGVMLVASLRATGAARG